MMFELSTMRLIMRGANVLSGFAIKLALYSSKVAGSVGFVIYEAFELMLHVFRLAKAAAKRDRLAASKMVRTVARCPMTRAV